MPQLINSGIHGFDVCAHIVMELLICGFLPRLAGSLARIAKALEANQRPPIISGGDSVFDYSKFGN